MNNTKHPVLMDGAVGTSLWAKAKARGLKQVSVWIYNLTCPDMVSELYHDYIDAGAGIILANSFGANRQAVEREHINGEEVVRTSVRLAREAVRESGKDVKVALACGPLMQLMEPYGDLTEEEVAEYYDEMFRWGIDEGADLIYLQTFMDVEMMRVAAERAVTYGVPVFCTMTFEKRGKTMMGNSVDTVLDTLTPIGIQAIGMNCSLGPDLALPVIREFAEKTDLPLIFKPNAGKPIMSSDGSPASEYTAETFLSEIRPAIGLVDYIGGCCGCDPSFIRLLREELDK